MPSDQPAVEPRLRCRRSARLAPPWPVPRTAQLARDRWPPALQHESSSRRQEGQPCRCCPAPPPSAAAPCPLLFPFRTPSPPASRLPSTEITIAAMPPLPLPCAPAHAKKAPQMVPPRIPFCYHSPSNLASPPLQPRLPTPPTALRIPCATAFRLPFSHPLRRTTAAPLTPSHLPPSQIELTSILCHTPPRAASTLEAPPPHRRRR